MKTREEIAKSIKSRFFILTQNGNEIPIDLSIINEKQEFLREYPELVKVIKFEVLGEKPGKVPPSVHLMQKLELVGYEAASDSGHFRFYPKGSLMLKLLEDWAEEIAIKRLGAMQIETPILYDWNHKSIRSQGESFHERHYSVKVPDHKDKEFVLRFAGDFGLFCMLGDSNISYKQLPLRVYEFSKSFRYELRGGLVGLRRLRGFSMPDVHSFCSDIEQGWEEYKELYRSYSDLANATETEYAIIFRIVDGFYMKHKNQILEMLQYSNQPAIIEVLSDMKHYWAVKHEFQGIDSVGGACQVATVQLDVMDAEKYGITYTDEKGKEVGCIICHSTIGALERWLFLVLESAMKMEVPQFPLWLSPEHVRFIPVSEEYLSHAIRLASEFYDKNIRVSVDDRQLTVGKKIRLASQEWTPYIVVVGQREVDMGIDTVKKRGVKNDISMTSEQLIKEISLSISQMPFRHSTFPRLMSKRPTFYG
ncbi:MAG: His/Gly/Thr/Pro-type tRNA ligase C-terminal domain-containing protein [Candidatus Moranbacteria bacterium]|nr:His/Gly/Thr/Pro-type tRNA ligase C-terminal domain-containing protein [Candidatus Moranbacteria bacterium]